MATPRIPNQKRQYNKLNERLAKYVLAVQSIYDDLNAKAAKIGLSTGYDGEGVFRFSDYPDVRRKVQALQEDFVSDIGALIMRGTSEEWKNSNLLQDLIADRAIKCYTGTRSTRPSKVSLVGGNEFAEITDDYHDYYLPKGVRSKIGEIEKIVTFNQAKEYFAKNGIKLETDVASLIGELGDDTGLKNVTKACQNLIAGVESYKEVFGEGSLKKLKTIRLKDNDVTAQASYHYNEVGEHDPFAGTLRIKSFNDAGAHNVFHELAHAYQDSMAEKGGSARTFTDKLFSKIEVGKNIRPYSGANADQRNMEAMAEGFAYAFETGKDDYVKFMQSVLNEQLSQERRNEYKQYYQTNSSQLKAFQQRKDRGMNLSAKLWNQSEEYKNELEAALSVGIERGTDAVTLSKRLSKYLNDFDSLKDSYKEKFGNATRVHDCEYRSVRLARSEINMAYRTAEQERWRQFDFVVGYEIKLSGSHPKEDICDRLACKYPKDFVWTGWHPNCLDYCVPILMTEDEFFNDKPVDEQEIVSYSEKKAAGEGLSGLDLIAVTHADEYKAYQGDAERGRTFQGYLAHLNGFAEPPQKLDPKSFGEYVAENNATIMYRGYRDHEAENIYNFVYGDAFDGKGQYGQGHYFSEHPWESFSETGRFIEAVPSKDFQFVEYTDELQQQWTQESRSYREGFSFSDYMKLTTEEERKDFELRSEAYSDFGAWATAKGYDGMIIHHIGGDDEYLVFNRSKLIVKSEETATQLSEEVARQSAKKSVNEVTELPSQFKQWCIDNSSRISDAEANNTLPYVLSDNSGMIFEAFGYSENAEECESIGQLLRKVESWYKTKTCTSHDDVPKFLRANGIYQKSLSEKYEFDQDFFALLDKKKDVVLELHYADDIDKSKHVGNVVKVKMNYESTDYGKIATIYHEYAHEIDTQRGLYKDDGFQTVVSELRSKYAKLSQIRNGEACTLGEAIDYDLRKLDLKLKGLSSEDVVRQYGYDYPTVHRMITKARDTIAGVDPNSKGFHSEEYWKSNVYNREKELIAHAFENKFIGNPITKEYLPDVFEALMKYVNTLKKYE